MANRHTPLDPSPEHQVTRPDIAERLLDVAARIAESEGFIALSVRRLAAEVGASRQVVYTHFDGMDGLLDALHRRASDLLAADMDALQEAPGTIANLRAAAHAYVRGARQRPALFDLNFAHPVPHFRPSPQAVAHGQRVFRVHIVQLVQAWQDETHPVPDHDEAQRRALELARLFWSSIHGLVVIERAGHAHPNETDRLVDETVTLLMTGWQARCTGRTRPLDAGTEGSD